MKRAVIEQRLKFAERHVTESLKYVSRHEIIVAKLESDGRQDSLTARAARALLESFETSWQHILLIATGCANISVPLREMLAMSVSDWGRAL
jgi:hypothetical protein